MILPRVPGKRAPDEVISLGNLNDSGLRSIPHEIKSIGWASQDACPSKKFENVLRSKLLKASSQVEAQTRRNIKIEQFSPIRSDFYDNSGGVITLFVGPQFIPKAHDLDALHDTAVRLLGELEQIGSLMPIDTILIFVEIDCPDGTGQIPLLAMRRDKTSGTGWTSKHDDISSLLSNDQGEQVGDIGKPFARYFLPGWNNKI